MKAIRAYCLGCVNNSPKEVELCPVTYCELYPFRFGKNPYRTKRELTEEQKAKLSEQLAKGRETQKQNNADSKI